MTNLDRAAETLSNGTVRHTYTSGPFTMVVFDRRESKNSDPSHVNLRTDSGALVAATAFPGLDPDDPDYVIETRTPSRNCDLVALIMEATTARDVLHDFREILLNDHEITTTLNGK